MDLNRLVASRGLEKDCVSPLSKPLGNERCMDQGPVLQLSLSQAAHNHVTLMNAYHHIVCCNAALLWQ